MRSHRDAAFTDYMSARMPALRRLARLLCQDWTRADDLLQAAMTKTYVHWYKAARADNTDAYVRAILVREFVEERRASWTRRVSLTDRPLFLVANEFFDALPVRQYVKTARGWCERMVTVLNGDLTFALAPVPSKAAVLAQYI